MQEGDGSLNRQEFLAEASEILETLGEELRLADAARVNGKIPAPLINALFRGVHSLKGIAGLVGREALGDVAHVLEDFLDNLRMGRTRLDAEKLDVLYDAHEMLEKLLAGETVSASARERLFRQLRSETAPVGRSETSEVTTENLGIDPQIFGALTQYEEHRLRESVADGLTVWMVTVILSLEVFDSELRTLIASLNEGGEVISTLPSHGGNEGELSFLLLYASGEEHESVQERAGKDVDVRLAAEMSATVSNDDATAAVADGVPAVDEIVSDGDGWMVERRSTVRVDLERLDRLMNNVGELIVSRRSLTMLVRQLIDSENPQALAVELARATRELGKKLDDLQRSVIGARMVPVGRIVGRLSRLVRKLSRATAKDVVFRAEGERTELDKVMIDRLLSPLMHLVRNAVDHGVESAQERLEAGKPATATLTLQASQRGNFVVLGFSDDGRGIQIERVRERAIARGVLHPSADLGPERISELIFSPGFSTSSEVSDVSGRGVGLDVVRREIAALGGSIRVKTTPGAGTTFEIEMPITLAIIQSMLTRSAGQVFAVPVSAVAETLRLRGDRLATVMRKRVVCLRGETFPMVDLAEFFDLDRDANIVPEYVLVLRSGETVVGLGVEEVLGQQEVVVKAIGRRLEGIPGLAGATELGENEAALVIDPTSLASEVCGLGSAA